MSASLVHAAVPQTMAFQGYLTDADGTPVTGTVTLAFALYDVASGGTALWNETHANVAVSKGIYSVILGGQGTPLNIPFDTQYYLGLTVGEDAEMSPRQALASAPSAMAKRTIIWSGYCGANNQNTGEVQYCLDESNFSSSDYVSYFSINENGAITINKSGLYKIVFYFTTNLSYSQSYVSIKVNNSPVAHRYFANYNNNDYSYFYTYEMSNIVNLQKDNIVSVVINNQESYSSSKYVYFGGKLFNSVLIEYLGSI
jgi:hypothetical protein